MNRSDIMNSYIIFGLIISFLVFKIGRLLMKILKLNEELKDRDNQILYLYSELYDRDKTIKELNKNQDLSDKIKKYMDERK
jgi:cell division protein FtsL